MNDKNDACLNEFDKVEWQDVARLLRPDLTADEFNTMWVEFCREKAAKAMQ